MSLIHYFLADADKRALFIFNSIAPIYGRLSYSLERNFIFSMNALLKVIPIEGKSVLDIGTGTGAWAANFKKAGAARVFGIDFSQKMLEQAKANYAAIEFEFGNAIDLNQFADNSFDIVTASFVLHGVKEPVRSKIILEMKRISKKYVVIHDFVGNTPLFVRLLEFMERSDYKYFKKNICDELKSQFAKTQKILVKFGTGIYLAEK